MTKLHVLYHGSCFDGCASAALFTAFYRGHVGDEGVSYGALLHGPPGPLPEGLFAGDENAIVDFGYSRSPRLTWWFDHHASGLKPDDRDDFAGRPSERFFYDPKAPSCAGFLARSLAARHGFDPGPHQELLHWADIIDSAAFPDAKMAVELREPALRIMTVLEASGSDEALQHHIIEMMQRRSLAEIVADPRVDAALQPLLVRHRRTIELVRERAVIDGGVVTFDLSDLAQDSYNKFIPYFLHPEAVYVVALSSSSQRVKVSVGSNPWRPAERRHDVASLCQRYGGGGHPVVGAISLPADAIEDGRRVAAEVAAALRLEQP
jgi:hypothetical protein